MSCLSSCPTGYYKDSTQCVCQTGYYNEISNSSCTPCNNTLSHCLQCITSTNCVSCSTPFVLSGWQCACDTNQFLNGSTCLNCSSTLIGCLTCSSGNVCTACDTSQSWQLSVSTCVCQAGYTYDPATYTCISFLCNDNNTQSGDGCFRN
jgi:hypothetical protein